MAVPVRTRTRVVRRIAADPTSTALLLAGPAAAELWPGVQREEGASSVLAEPPRRTPTAYVSTFAWTAPGLPPTTGVLTLAYAPAADGTVCTQAALELDATDLPGRRLDERALRTLAQEFLDNLGRAAEQRSRAA